MYFARTLIESLPDSYVYNYLGSSSYMVNIVTCIGIETVSNIFGMDSVL